MLEHVGLQSAVFGLIHRGRTETPWQIPWAAGEVFIHHLGGEHGGRRKAVAAPRGDKSPWVREVGNAVFLRVVETIGAVLPPVCDGIHNNGVFGGVESGVVELVSHVHVEVANIWNPEGTPVFKSVAGLHHQRLSASVDGQGSCFMGPDVAAAGAIGIGRGAEIDSGMQSTIPRGGVSLEANVSVVPVPTDVVVDHGELSSVPFGGITGVCDTKIFQVGKRLSQLGLITGLPDRREQN